MRFLFNEHQHLAMWCADFTDNLTTYKVAKFFDLVNIVLLNVKL